MTVSASRTDKKSHLNYNDDVIKNWKCIIVDSDAPTCTFESNLLTLSSNIARKAKIWNTSCMLKRPRKTVQTKIRLLLKKQSDQGLPCMLF